MEVTRSKNKTRLHAILLPRGAGVRFFEVVVALSSKELEQRRPKLTSQKDERLTLGHICVYSWKCHALCYAVFGFASNRWINTLNGIVWETKYGRFITLNIPKCVIFTLISVVRRLGNVQSFNTYMFRFWASCHERDPGWAVTPPWQVYMANCKGGVTRLGGLPVLLGRVTRSAGVTICHVNVSRWGNPPSRGRVHGKKLKSETYMF